MQKPNEGLVMIDGQIRTPETAVISVFDRGFLYGDSVFEVVRVYEGKPFALTEHVDRLYASANAVHIDVRLPRQSMCDEVLAVIAASGGGDKLVRIHVTRGVGPLGLDPSDVSDSCRVVMVMPIHPPAPEAYQHGVSVCLFRTERAVDNTEAAGAKVANYLVSLLALRQARSVGANEALIIDGKGRVLEGATSNVFVINHGVVMTPPEAEGILTGITREYVLRAAESLQLPIRITTLTRGDLSTADEVFITSTTREVLPVVLVDGQPVADGQVGPITRALHGRFRQLAGLPGRLPWQSSP